MNEVQRFVRRLRDTADTMATHADLLDSYRQENVIPDGVEYENWKDYTYLSYYVSGGSLDISVTGPDSKDLVRKLRRALRPGKWTKSTWGERFSIHTPYDSDRGMITIDTPRDSVCTRVVTGTKTVTVPATEAVEAVPESTKVVDVVEWDCGNLLDDSEPVAPGGVYLDDDDE